MSRMGRELGEQRLLDAATIVRDRPGLLPAAGVDAALADVLEALAPLAPYWAEPYAAPFVPILERALRLAHALQAARDQADTGSAQPGTDAAANEHGTVTT